MRRADPRVVALALAALGLFFMSSSEDPGAPARRREAKVQAEREMLRGQAETACLCERRRGPDAKQACWSRFEASMAARNAPGGDGETACDPISETVRDWPANGTFYVITTQYHPNLPGPPITLCTAAEASTVEQAMNKAMDNPAAMKEAEKLARSITTGHSFAAAPGKPGCG